MVNGPKIHLFSGLKDSSSCEGALSAEGLGLEPEVQRFASALEVPAAAIQVHDLIAITRGEIAMPDLSSMDMAIIGGSPEGIDESEPEHVEREAELTDRIYHATDNLLMVCYGWQLGARALGGEIGKANPGERGYRILDISGTPLAQVFRRDWIWVSTVHNDAVFVLPRGFEALTDPKDSSGIQMAWSNHRGVRALATQFHPEILTRDPESLISQMPADPSARVITSLPTGAHLYGPEIIRSFFS